LIEDILYITRNVGELDTFEKLLLDFYCPLDFNSNEVVIELTSAVEKLSGNPKELKLKIRLNNVSVQIMTKFYSILGSLKLLENIEIELILTGSNDYKKKIFKELSWAESLLYRSLIHMHSLKSYNLTLV